MIGVRFGRRLLLLAVFSLAWAQDRPPVATPGFASGAAVPIGPGDLLQMTVFDTPELSGTLRVNNQGDIFVPLIGCLQVAGLDAEYAQTLIRKKLVEGGFIRDPQVTLFVVEYSTQGVAVAGEVKKPGIYPLFGEHRLLDYISLAGGLTSAGGTAVTITRRRQAQPALRVTLKMGETPAAENNPAISPGDTIFVEKSGIVYVVGDVGKPGGFSLDYDERLTVLQALALAQGANHTAAEKKARLIRTSGSGRQEIPVNLKKIASAQADDLPMQDQDILFVPGSASKGAVKRGLEAAVQAAIGVTVYRR
jgi:polysaccharide biosynthesis/export protein